MKIGVKASLAALSLSLIGSGVFAQSLADAKAAIDAEQYQKAKSLLKNLTVTQSGKDENFFYLGLVYVLQEYPDSAKAVFTEGIAKNAKSALNYVGLGMVNRLDKDETTAKANFDKAFLLAPKDDKPYVFAAKAYLLKGTTADANAAIAILEKGKVLPAGAKDPELFATYGDAYRWLKDSNNAYLNYKQAQDLDPKSASVAVGLGVLWKYAHNFDDATTQFNAALGFDPNFGPAYREMAESALLQAQTEPKNATEKIKTAADYYKKYLDLTDRSIESRMRYADFLITAGDYKTLEQEANALAQSSKSDLRIYRYLAYSAYENGNYAAGLEAINKWFKGADPKRIINRDYLYLARLQVKNGLDSVGYISYKKLLDLDSTQTDVYGELAFAYYTKRKYVEAGDTYAKYFAVSHKGKLTEYFKQGLAYYFGYNQQSTAAEKNKTLKVDSGLLAKADSAFSYVIQKTAAHPFPEAVLYRAYINDEKETDRLNHYKGYAKPFYEKYIEMVAPTNPTDESTKKKLVSAYVYMGYYYQFAVKDEAKETEYFNKAKELDPTNKSVVSFFAGKGK